MATLAAIPETVEYRVILVRQDSPCILAVDVLGYYRLPRVRIPQLTRPAQQLQTVIEATWDLDIFVLEIAMEENGLAPCVVAELLTPRKCSDFMEVRLDQVLGSELSEKERTDLAQLLAGNSKSPLSRIGWVRGAVRWIEDKTGDKVLLPGGVEQHNAGGGFALVRFRTSSGQVYWLKATGNPNRHELALTARLAELSSAHLPDLIATQRDWNAWLMKNAGAPLEVSGVALGSTITSMAELQKKTVGQSHSLLASGAADHRMSTLCPRIPELIAYLEDAMAHQTSTKVSRIAPMRLREIGNILEDTCTTMDDLQIPDTIIHNDISPGNILVQNDRCVFIDWCEGYVGNPFVTLERLLRLLPEHELHPGTLRRLKHSYKQEWIETLSEWKIDQAFALMPLQAIGSYLYGRGDWLRSDQKNQPQIQSYSRTLARYMDKAAQAPSLREALCHSM
jgi:hypothetical protein